MFLKEWPFFYLLSRFSYFFEKFYSKTGEKT